MQFLKAIKENFKFLSLTFFVFFISCVVQAQDTKNQSSTLINKTEDVEKLPAVEEKKVIKRIINKPSKLSKKKLKYSKKKNKKNHKINKKRIIKKVNLTKKNLKNKNEKVPVLTANKYIKIDESLEKYKNGELNNFQEIDGEYLIEVELKDSCDRITGEECFRSDKFFQEPYFHYTILNIFNQKVIAEQFFEGEGRLKDKVFLKVKDGEYLLYTKNNNKIFLVVKNGVVNDLIVLEGDLKKETKIVNKCQYADNLLAFHRLYGTNENQEISFYYSDIKNFKGLIEATIFSEKYQPKTLYSVLKIPNKEIYPIQNLNLCKNENNIQAIERDFTKKECDRKIRCTMETLANYGSEGFYVKDINFTFDDFYKNNKVINLNKEQAKGLLQEVSKMSSEDKKILKSRCFDDKNIDFINCSAYEKCQDYLVVEACEVNYFYDFK